MIARRGRTAGRPPERTPRTPRTGRGIGRQDSHIRAQFPEGPERTPPTPRTGRGIGRQDSHIRAQFPPRVVAASDCETCREARITQPVNTVSSLAYVVAGLDADRAARRVDGPGRAPARALAWSLVGTGLGSVAYHGPGGALSRWAHDATLLTTLGLVLQTDIAHLRGSAPPTPAALAAVPLAAGAAAMPRTSMAAQVGVGTAMAVGAYVRIVRDPRTREQASARAVDLVAWTLGLAAHLAGRSDSPLCRPDSVLQPHAVWHLLSAWALRGAAMARSTPASGPPPSR